MQRETCRTCHAKIPTGEGAYCSPTCIELAGIEAATIADVIERHLARPGRAPR